ncbi:MAG TPA: SDR family oxidoreductase [Dehalococcoidia bacterium]|nr:SDR family oxidoreductase [Dehalococcoidia bacterium]
MGELDGQVAIVTGGGRGIGRAVAVALVQAGAAVSVAARSADELADTSKAIATAGGRVVAVPTDVRDATAVRHLVAETEQQLGPVTLLVNNAGTPGPAGNDWEVDAEQWWECQEVIVRGAFLCHQAVVPGMLARGGGRIINMVSVTGTRAYPPIMATSVAKTALLRMTEGLAQTAGPHGVHVFAVHPGVVKTRLLLSYKFGLPESVYAPAERAADLCVRLASGRYDALSGRFLTIDDDLDALGQRAAELAQQEQLLLRIKT